ncbi:hypothetical protein DY036_07470, partial [Apilactobacillus kunkeei]
MLYNHNKFRKNSDKKVMRKVKKNWIVLSVVSFALIGTAAVIDSNSNVAFASENQNNSTPTGNDKITSPKPVTTVSNTSKSKDYTPDNSQILKTSVSNAKNNGIDFNETSQQKTETDKNTAVNDAKEVSQYNQNKIDEINQSVDKYKSDLNDYKSKLDDYNAQVNKYADEIKKAKQLQSQGIVDASLLLQQLNLGDEPDAKLQVTQVANGLTVNNNSRSPIKNSGVSDNEQASRISYDGTNNYKGGLAAVASFTNLKNSYYQDSTGLKHNISKIVETFSDLSSQPATSNFTNILNSKFLNDKNMSTVTTPSITIYHDPAHGFVFAASSGVTMKSEYYDDKGNLIPLNDDSNAYLVIGSLNNWNNTGGNHKEGLTVNSDSDAHPYQVNGSSVTKHSSDNGVSMYSDNTNPSTPDGHFWDSAGSPYSYYGSVIVKLTGTNNSVRFTRSAPSSDDFPFVWSTVSSSLVGQSAAIPNLFKPLQPSKPVIDVNYTSINLLEGINKIHYVVGSNDEEELPTDTSNGDNSEYDGLTTSTKISNLEKNGYVLVSDNHGDESRSFIGGVEQDFTVTLEHKVDTVTPDNPGTPGQPINPDNPNGPKWPNGTDKDSLSKTVNQTINYVDGNGKSVHDASHDQVTFGRTATVDEVTGQVTYGDWNNASGTFSPKVSPVVPGYVLRDESQKTIPAVTVNPSSSDSNETVIYDKVGSLVPVDTAGNPIDNGSHNTSYPNDPNDAGKVTNPGIPSIPGKTPVDKDGNPLTPGSTYPIDGTKPTEDTKITYVDSNQKAKVSYIDSTTGKTLESADLSGQPQSTSDYRTTDTIKKYTDQGYKLVSDNYPANGVKFHSDNQEQDFTVTLEHKVDTVTPDNPGTPGQPINPDNPNGPKWPNGTDKDSLSKTVNQTINYVDGNGKSVH